MKAGWKANGALVIASAAVFIVCGMAQGQDYPTKPIRMVIPTASGGATDNLARLVATHLSRRVGVSVVVENKPGAMNVIGVETAVRSVPDGYTILFCPMDGLGIMPPSVRLPYDAAKDLIPVVKMAQGSVVFAVGAKVPAKNIKEFIALAKAQPGKLSFATNGLGGITHLAGELLKSRAGINIVPVPYNQGTAATAIPDTIAGRIEMIATGASVVSNHAKTGTLTVLAVAAPSRIVALPDVPTMIESGFSDFVASAFYGVFVPAGTLGDIVRKLAKDLSAVANSDEFIVQLPKYGAEKANVLVLDDFGREIAAQTKLWHALVKEANIKLAE